MKSLFQPSLKAAPLAVAAMSLCAAPSAATDYVIYVASNNTPAAAAAEAKADGNTVFAEKSVQKALDRTGTLLGSGEHTASVLIAGGNYIGKAGAGTLVVPTIKNLKATLRIVGGYGADFSTRAPFQNPTRFSTNIGRNQAMLLLGKQSQLKEIVISGLVLDAKESNKYDGPTNSLLKGSSRTVPLLNLSLLMTDRVVIADNVFLNGAHGAFDPWIAPVSSNTVVDITNNFFLNTVKTLQVGAGIGYKNFTVKEVNVRGNTFLLNWPYNPDTTSSNVSALTLYHKGGAQALNIEGNIFAFNPGGAMQHDWTEDRMPRVSLKNNLFFHNAALFGQGDADAGVFVGKFGANAKYLILGMETVANDFSYVFRDNVSFDPKIPIALLPLQSANSESVERQNTVMNDVRRLFGQNQDGGTVKIANYAPAMDFDTKTLPLPAEEKAKPYGVQVDKLWSPGGAGVAE